jgi:putative ABC transport system permease protein
MFRNFLKLALRNMIRQRSYIFINVIGLSTGLACSILIALFVKHELNYDSFNEHKNEIYRMLCLGRIGDSELNGAWTCYPLGSTLKSDLPEVLNFVRFDKWGETIVKYEEKSYVEDGIMMVDSTFFDIFSIPLIVGDPKNVLSVKRNLVLTRSAAEKYFGNEDPVGKMLKVGTDTVLYSVTGVMENVPENAHFEFNILVSFVTSNQADNGFWLSNTPDTYIRVDKGVDQDKLQEKINNIVLNNVGPQIESLLGITLEDFTKAGNSYGYFIQPLLDIHLDPSIDHSHKPSGDKKTIFIFTLVAILILVIAGINYMNLATARSAGRAKEVGIRKIAGSTRRSLIIQFLFESMVLTFVSILLGVLIVELQMNFFNNLIHLRLNIDYLAWYTIPGLIILTIIMGLLSGTYPSFFLASFKPVTILTGSLQRGAKSKILRSILVVFQMSISILIILGTLIIYSQIRYMTNKDLGFDKENILVVRRPSALGEQQETFMEEVKKLPGVKNISHSTATPVHTNNYNGYWIEGEPTENSYLMQTFQVDENFVETYGIKVIEGRFFSEDFATDSMTCLINESAVNQFGFESPYDFRIMRPTSQEGDVEYLNILGVVKNFHFHSLHDRILPAILLLKPENVRWGYISISLSPENINQTISQIEKIWREFSDNDPLLSFFMDEEFDSKYQEDRRTGILAVIFSFLSILIAGLGLYGLSSFTSEQRTTEIGIRKVNGASTSTILGLLSKEIIILVGISTIITWPVSYIVMKTWLQNFYFRVPWSPMPYLLSLCVVLAVTWLSISYQAIKASRINPAEALRYQ